MNSDRLPTYHPGAIHSPKSLGKDLPAGFAYKSITFKDGSVWVVKAVVKLEGDYAVVYTQSLGCHVFAKNSIQKVV